MYLLYDFISLTIDFLSTWKYKCRFRRQFIFSFSKSLKNALHHIIYKHEYMSSAPTNLSIIQINAIFSFWEANISFIATCILSFSRLHSHTYELNRWVSWHVLIRNWTTLKHSFSWESINNYRLSHIIYYIY